MSSHRDAYVCGSPFDQELRSGAMAQTDLAPIASRLGAQGVEYRTIYWSDRDRELPIVRQQLQGLGLKCTYATFGTLFDPDPEARAKLLQDIDDAATLGAPMLRVFLGPIPMDAAGEAAARAAIDHAAERGVVLAVENYVRSPGNRLPDMVAAMELLGSAVVGTNLDIGNYVKNGQDPLEAARQLSAWTVYCHLKDVRTGKDGYETTYPGNGDLDLRPLFASADVIGPTVPVCFEYPGEGDPEHAIRQGVEFVATL